MTASTPAALAAFRCRLQRNRGRCHETDHVVLQNADRTVLVRRQSPPRMKCHDLLWQVQPITLDISQCFLARTCIGDRRARSNQRRIVAGNVRHDQGHDPRRVGSGSQPPALDQRDMLAHRIHCADRRAGGQQRAVDGNLVLQRQPGRRHRQQCRPAAADQRDNEIVLCEAAYLLHQPLRRP